MISPFDERNVVDGYSRGLSVAGYDITIAEGFFLGSKEFRLASAAQKFCIPNDLVMHIKDKSSWARRGLQVFNTVAEPGWEGYLTLELVNHGPDTLRLEPGMPIAQVLFELTDEPVERPYSGKYQNQEAGPQPARREG